MATTQITVERFSVSSSKPFESVVAAFEDAIGHPEMPTFQKSISAAETYAEVKHIVNNSAGSYGLMEFTRMNLGEVGRKRDPRVRRVCGSSSEIR